MSALITVLGVVALIAMNYLFVAGVWYALLFRHAAWSGDRWYLSLRWPITVPLTPYYYARYRMAERRWNKAKRPRIPASVVLAFATYDAAHKHERDE